MNKLIIFLLISIFVVGGIAFFSQYHIKNSFLTKELPDITDNEINKVLDIMRKMYEGTDMVELEGDFFKRDSIINLVHIKKENSDYKISCWFGPAYERANLYKMFPEEPVSMGQIKECNLETAKAIDEAVKSSEIDCRVFTSQAPSSLTDYYFFAISIREREVNQEWIDKLNQKWIDNKQALKCFEPLGDIIGETVSKHGTGVVDLSKNTIYE